MNFGLRIIIVLFFVLNVDFDISAQPFVVKGHVQETFSKSPLAFAHIVVNHGEMQLLADINGDFLIESQRPVTFIKCSQDMHRTSELDFENTPQDSLTISLNRYLPFFMERSTDTGTYAIIKKIILSRKTLNIEEKGGFSYLTYNKFTFTYDAKRELSENIEFAMRILFPRLRSFKGDHHLLLVESATEKDFKDYVHQKEKILGSRISGFDDPSLLALSSSVQHFSIYDDIILMGTQKYVGPLHWNAFKRYTFNTIDTLSFPDSTIYVVKFHPKPRSHFEAVKGYLYIHKEKNAVLNVQISPITSGFFTTDVLQTYVENKATHQWMPQETKTMLTLEEYGPNRLALLGTGRTFYYGYQKRENYKKNQFNEYILAYSDSANFRDSTFWEFHRKEGITTKDKNTFTYFEKIGNIKAKNWIHLGENLVRGKIPIGPVTLELNKIINFNNYENTRFGMGFFTNEKLSKYWMVGGYVNYGTRDMAYKWGARGNILLYKEKDLKFNYAISNDLSETGMPSFAFDRFQFSSEPIRKYQVSQYDFTFKNEVFLTAHPLTYLDVKLGMEFSRKTPTYQYRYSLDTTKTNFQFSEIIFGLRYAYGEQYLKTIYNNIFLGTKFPVIYFQFTKAINGFAGGGYDYTKLDAKFEYRRRIIGFGTSFIQIIGGMALGNLPYPALYTGRGAFRNLSVVMHNSFETMRYNEFVSDRYWALHYSHIFGKLHFRDTRFQPEFEMLHSIGFGGLANASHHERVTFQTMEKGYFESGLFVNNIISLKLIGLRIGFGTGVFFRYGPYRLLGVSDNLVFKLSVGFNM